MVGLRIAMLPFLALARWRPGPGIMLGIDRKSKLPKKQFC
jgi:hypothetical protein